MPALSSTGPERASRIVLRPRWGRWVAEVFALLVLAAFTLAAIGPAGAPGARDHRPVDRTAIFAVGLLVAVVVHRLGSARVLVLDDGVVVVNPLRRRHIPWWQIRGVRLERGDPWMILQLVDDETVLAMGVQGSDGAHAREQALALARLVVAGQQRGRAN